MILVVKYGECSSISHSTIQVDQLEFHKTAILESEGYDITVVGKQHGQISLGSGTLRHM